MAESLCVRCYHPAAECECVAPDKSAVYAQFIRDCMAMDIETLRDVSGMARAALRSREWVHETYTPEQEEGALSKLMTDIDNFQKYPEHFDGGIDV